MWFLGQDNWQSYYMNYSVKDDDFVCLLDLVCDSVFDNEMGVASSEVIFYLDAYMNVLRLLYYDDNHTCCHGIIQIRQVFLI